MKNWHWMTAAALAASLAGGAAMAATIDNLSGQSCGGFSGNWHFVNNQTGGAGPGFLTATWSSGDSCAVSPSKVSANNQQFNCVASGTLVSASTNLPGKLVLSDFSCSSTEPPPPPPCDPKKEICEPPK